MSLSGDPRLRVSHPLRRPAVGRLVIATALGAAGLLASGAGTSGCADDVIPLLDIDAVDPNALPKVRYGSSSNAGSASDADPDASTGD